MHGPSGISSKSIGLIVAGLLTLIFAIIIWISIASSGSTPTNSNADLFPNDPTEIPNINETQTGGAMLVTMVDKNDPTRIAGTLKADRFEPIGEGRRRLDKPEAWIHLKDGRAIKVTADYATMLMPDPNQPPESGTLEGNIRIEAFHSNPAADTPISQHAEPMMVALFDQPVEFERRYLRLRSAGHFEIASEQFDFSGSDLTIILNELRDRVELIDVVVGDRLIIHTNANKRVTAATQPGTQQTTSPTAQPTIAQLPTEQSAQAQETTPQTTTQASSQPIPSVTDTLSRYHITLNDKINAIVTDSGTATADRLELWAALEGGSLPADAIRTIAFAPQTQPDAPPSTTPSLKQPGVSNPDSNGTTTSQPASAAPIASRVDETNDIVITWSGNMTVRPIDDRIPPQLVSDDLTLKLAANEGHGITFDVPERGFTGQAYSGTYHATRGVIELESTQTQAGIIELNSPEAGSLIAQSFAVDLSTGRIDLDQRGQITSTPGGSISPDDQATIQWKDSASFTLAKIDSALTDRLTRARFDGTVIAKQGGNSIGARSLDARFDPTLPPDLSLTKLSLDRGVLSSASKSILSGSELEIDFAPASFGNKLDPTRLRADGEVFGRDQQSMLKADHLVATLYRDLAGEMIIRTADAQGNIEYTGVDRTSAEGELLSVDGVNETMTLIGSNASVAQGGSSIVGDHINLNARRRGIEVIGPGSFDHDIMLEDSEPGAMPAGHIRATWKGSMRFDDAIGSIVCEDQVRVVSTPDAYTRDTLDAHRAEIKITPLPTADPIAGTTGRRGQPNPQRELMRARIYGHAPSGSDPIPAKIESRTYAQDDPERVIGLIYLEGSQIIADNQKQTLDVPAPGTLLILDRTQEDQVDTATTSIAAVGPGLTRFTWQGRMNLNRASGTADFVDQVMVRQKTLSTGKVATLSTDALDARFEIGLQDQDQSTRLLSAQATGSVRFIFSGRELLADLASYDAIEDSLFASAIDNKLVTLYDDDQPAPRSARTIRWDLTRDRIEINAPSPARGTGG